MARSLASRRCHVCGQKTLRRVQRPYEYEVSHDGRAPVRIRIPDLEVIACTNPDCRPEHPDDTVIQDDAAIWRVTEETYRQLGLLTPAEIRCGRERLGLNQQRLQELLGLGGNSLSRWENGHVYQSRSMDTLLRIIFNVPAAKEYLEAVRRAEGAPTGERQVKFQYLGIDGECPQDSSARKSFSPAEFLAGSEVHAP